MRLVWVNDNAAPVGGCEAYIRDTALGLRSRGVSSTLLYQVSGAMEARWMRHFDGAFPMVDIHRQIKELAPDLVYIHRLEGVREAQLFSELTCPAVRFFHDHKLFCLREHKYTAIRNQTCKRTIGWRCYPCLGFINRSDRWPGIRWQRIGSLRAEQRANMQFDAFITSSEYMAGHLAAHGFDRNRIHVIPLYVMPPQETENVARDPKLLFFAGQMVRGKGVDILLKALAQTRDEIRLILAGRGRLEDEFKQLCGELKLDHRVTFMGRLDPDQMTEYYQKAACVIFPSRAPETFGLIGPEAMRYGAPIIASDVGGVREWLEDGVTGVAVPPNDVQALTETITRMIDDPGRASALGEAGRKRCLECFMPDRHLDSLLALFQSLTEGRTT